MQTLRRTLAILLIIAISLGVGFAVDLIWDKAEQKNHPQSYGEWITKYSVEYNIPEYVIYAVIKTESGFDPNATSSAGAIGLMQMTEIAHKDTVQKLQDGTKFKDLYDPETNIRHGVCYLHMMYQTFHYDWNLAFAAYNAGQGNVTKWLKNPEYTDEEGKLTYIPFDETRSYVKKVNEAIEMYQKLYYNPNEGVTT